MKAEEYDVPSDLYYTKDHEWLKVEGEMCRIGITDYAQKSLHEVVYVDLPKANMKVSKKNSLGTVESVKAVSDYFAPISGEVIEVNSTLENKPDLINKSSYKEGWIAIIKPNNLNTDLKELMDSTEYLNFIKSLVEK